MNPSLIKAKVLLLALISGLIFTGCSDNTDMGITDNQVPTTLRSAIDNSFDWYKDKDIKTINPYLNKTVYLTLPWAPGSSDNAGIPKEWIDSNTFNPDFSQRFYSPDKGWVMVYSNMSQNTFAKYFALYNKYTGILRFFFFTLGSSSGTGTTESLWGIAVDKSTSLMNFSYNLANGIDKKIEQPSMVTTPQGSIAGTTYSSTGYKENIWYGLEFECAYDPSLLNNNSSFYVKGWAVNKITLTGKATTTGTITGTIKTNTPNSSGFNLSLSNMFNTTNSTSTVMADKESAATDLGKKIDDGISKNDNFFKGLWSNVKNNASKWISSGLQAGAEKGLSAILTSGGSVIGEAVGGLFNSLIGGGKKETISKVDLALNSTTDIKIEGETTLTGWGAISALPIPGSSTNPYNQPIYNKLLGVWNLKETPSIQCNNIVSEYWVGTRQNPQYFQYAEYHHTYTLGEIQIVMNPEVENLFERINTKYSIFMNGGNHPEYDNIDLNNYTPGALLNDKKYYDAGGVVVERKTYTSYNQSYRARRPLSINFLINVSFQLKHKVSGEIYYFSRYFNVGKYTDNITIGKFYMKQPDPSRPLQ